MNSKIASVALAGLFAFILSGCGSAPTMTSEAPKEAAKPALSAEAQQVLTQAEADVKLAKSKFALWTVTETALKAAQEAAKAGDSAAVMKQATMASTLAKAGIDQVSYPSTEQK